MGLKLLKLRIKSIIAFFKCRFITHKPFLLTHILTYDCNCKCQMCPYWKIKGKRNELSLPEIKKILDKVSKAGFVEYAIWGGEPLIRNDLPEILKYAKKKKMHTTLITNGYLLEEKAKLIGPYVDTLMVSIDHFGVKHDKQRKLKNVFKKAVQGIKKMKNYKNYIMINSVINKINYKVMEQLVDFAEELKVGITFELMQEDETNKHLSISKKKTQEVFKELLELKKHHKNILNSREFLKQFTEGKTYSCHQPKTYLTIDPYGNIFPCSHHSSKNLGNLKNQELKQLVNSNKYKSFVRKAESCNKCVFSEVIESSLFYSFNLKLIGDQVLTLLKLSTPR